MMLRTVLFSLTVLSVACVPKGQYARLKDAHVATQTQLDSERERAARLENELAEARRNVDALKESLKQLQAARDAAIQQLEQDVARARESGSARASELQSELERARQERQGQVDALQAELDAAREEARRKAEELAKLNSTYGDLVKGLQQEIEEGRVTITNLKGRVTVNLIDKILFDSGSAELNVDGKRVLDKVSGVLKNVKDRRITVEGHTDNVPIAKAAMDRFPSNWELSTARSSTVVRYLVDHGVPAGKLAATGYGMFQPVAANDTEDGRRLNRRIEIVLMPIIAEDTDLQ